MAQIIDVININRSRFTKFAEEWLTIPTEAYCGGLIRDVYIADAIDYQQQGMILRYSPQGEELDKFYVGIIPGAFCWK